MRGNPRNQAKQIFRPLNKIGTSRHVSKKEALKNGAHGTHEIAQKTGIHSYNTMNLYIKITTEFLTWARNTYNIKDSTKINGEHIQEWLHIKIANNCKYKTFTTYTSALQKANIGMNKIYNKNFDWSKHIEETRKQAKRFTSSTIKPRAYERPQEIVDQLHGNEKTAAELQLYSGCRVNEISKLKPK